MKASVLDQDKNDLHMNWYLELFAGIFLKPGLQAHSVT